MAFTKTTYVRIARLLLFIYLALFPFGQLLRLNFAVNFGSLHDVVVFLCIPLYFLPGVKRLKHVKYFLAFFAAALFSSVLYAMNLRPLEVVYGLVYLLRIFSYYTFSVIIYNLLKDKEVSPASVVGWLTFDTVAISVLGWLQYFMFPDLRFLRYLNWDDHLGRMTGTFLDPGYLGILLVLGSILAFYLWRTHRRKLAGGIFVFVSLSLLFTYSRASYLAFVAGMTYLVLSGFRGRSLFVALVFILGLLIIPKNTAEGTSILRTQSVIARFENYSETLSVAKENPLFGIGFNNLCSQRLRNFGGDFKSHACSGSDSSILLLVATTGVVGIMIFLKLFISIFKRNFGDLVLIKSLLMAIFVHSLFTQSMFYSFVMGYMAILIPLATQGLFAKKVKEKVTVGKILPE